MSLKGISDDFGCCFFCSKLAEFLHVAFISVEKHRPVSFFMLVCTSFSRYYVCKQPSVFQAASFGDLLLYEKQKKPFVSLKDEVTITQFFLTAASLAQVDNAPNGADSNLFCCDTRGLNSRSVKSFSVFCFSSSFKTLLDVFVIELPLLLARIWIMFFLAAIVTLAFWRVKH